MPLAMKTNRLRIIVSGLLAQYPIGGVTWDYLQYVLGFARLGHDVYYLEDTGQWPYNPLAREVSNIPDFSVQYLQRVMSEFGFADRWAYRFPWESRWFGLSNSQRRNLIESADLLVNVSCALQSPSEYRQVKKLIYVDTDPVFTQIKLIRGQRDFRQLIDAHDLHFSYGERLEESALVTGHRWCPLRKPIVLSEWRHSAPFRDVFTTVMNWTSYKNIEFQGTIYGQKDMEFMRFLELPRLVAPTALELAAGSGKTKQMPNELLTRSGWHLVDPMTVCPDVSTYRTYIESSKGEWTVAKHGYVSGQVGWFSGRTACYLAAGRPVIVQDTGFSSVIPSGEGVLAFRTLEEAAAGIKDVDGHYQKHAKAALEIAEVYFDSSKVLSRLIEESFRTDVALPN